MVQTSSKPTRRRIGDDDAHALADVVRARAAVVPVQVKAGVLRERAEHPRDGVSGAEQGHGACQTTPWQFQEPLKVCPNPAPLYFDLNVPWVGKCPERVTRLFAIRFPSW